MSYSLTVYLSERCFHLKILFYEISQQPLSVGESNRGKSNYKPHFPPSPPTRRFNLLIALSLTPFKIRLDGLHPLQLLVCIRRISVSHESIEPGGQCDNSPLMTEGKDPVSTVI